MGKLFTYGSLMCDDIMFRVAGDCTVIGKTVLTDYRCLAVRNEEYPAIVPQPGFSTLGVLYDHISDEGFTHLDDFEGEMYRRITVWVSLESGTQTDAFAYVFRPEFKHLLTDREWSFEHFLNSGKAAFIARYVGFSKI
ncbi:MAG: gamma-glutamylcyclotransferase [Deltaproteobacteria bacterium]|nr:gamma-glutamylcyclotransferase [Deltaproteobacteria bacterium]